MGEGEHEKEGEGVERENESKNLAHGTGPDVMHCVSKVLQLQGASVR